MWLALALLGALLLQPLPAGAEAETDTRLAAELFRQGAELYRQGRYDIALKEFSSSMRYRRRSSTLLNMAQCYRQLGRREEALNHYLLYLSEYANESGGQRSPHQAEVEGRIAQLRAELERAGAKRPSSPTSTLSTETKGTPRGDVLGKEGLGGALLSMRTDVEGASIYLDGRELTSTPAEKVRIPPGRRRIRVSHPGRQSWTGAIDFEPGGLVDARVKLGRPSWAFWTALGVATAGLVLAAVTGGLAIEQRKEQNAIVGRSGDERRVGACLGWGSPVVPFSPDATRDGKAQAAVNCSGALPALSTAGTVLAGTGLVTAVAYYLLWGRPRATVRKVRISD